MTLSNDKVEKFLKRYFVAGWTNIKGKKRYAGSSNTHLPTHAAWQVNNCAGHHNIQMFFMTADGRVLHCLPGYWSADHFLHEAEFAVKVARVYYAKELSASEKNDKFLDLHLTHALSHSEVLQRSSRLQGFDKKHVATKTTDFQREEGFVSGLKTPDQVIHERMAALPFLPFEKFDVASYINLGVKRYKYDYGLEKEGYGKKRTARGSKKAGHKCKCGSSCGCASCGCST